MTGSAYATPVPAVNDNARPHRAAATEFFDNRLTIVRDLPSYAAPPTSPGSDRDPHATRHCARHHANPRCRLRTRHRTLAVRSSPELDPEAWRPGRSKAMGR